MTAVIFLLFVCIALTMCTMVFLYGWIAGNFTLLDKAIDEIRDELRKLQK